MNVSRLAQAAGVGRTSLYRWMGDDGTRVTIESATKIAEAIGDDPANALRAAGSLLDRPIPDLSDPVVARIMELDMDEDMRQWMLQRHAENVERDRQRYLDDVERDAEAFRRRTGAA